MQLLLWAKHACIYVIVIMHKLNPIHQMIIFYPHFQLKTRVISTNTLPADSHSPKQKFLHQDLVTVQLIPTSQAWYE